MLVAYGMEESDEAVTIESLTLLFGRRELRVRSTKSRKNRYCQACKQTIFVGQLGHHMEHVRPPSSGRSELSRPAGPDNISAEYIGSLCDECAEQVGIPIRG